MPSRERMNTESTAGTRRSARFQYRVHTWVQAKDTSHVNFNANKDKTDYIKLSRDRLICISLHINLDVPRVESRKVSGSTNEVLKKIGEPRIVGTRLTFAKADKNLASFRLWRWCDETIRSWTICQLRSGSSCEKWKQTNNSIEFHVLKVIRKTEQSHF